ncbi:hypothetical protein LXA47_15835 [Massilia sp. P8910]|uniref:hypothetical protein n=1 Tax=Massilia antarctica TaxID=2765360 RepID=UPI001E5A3BC2|nr:hypothetical protein [Massilia antarctica]MCE3605073.1 hypothetical protein [Massilia antarctica]
MQHREDPPPAFRRPSLLSEEQQEAAARAGAQARKEAEAADSARLKADQAKRSKTRWMTGAAALLAVCAGGGAWLALDAGKPAAVVTVAAARPDPAPALKPAAPAVPTESEVSAAAILGHGAAPPAPAKGESLKDMLNAPAAPKAKGDELDQLLAGSPAAPMSGELKGALQASAKGAVHGHPAAVSREASKKPVLLAKSAPAKALPPKGALAKPGPLKAAPVKAAPGDDASLLAALVAHSREGSGGTASNAGASQTSLRQCKQLNAAQAEQCRVRLCAGTAKDDPQCKSPRVTKPAAD